MKQVNHFKKRKYHLLWIFFCLSIFVSACAPEAGQVQTSLLPINLLHLQARTLRTAPDAAQPVYGNTPWVVALCKFSDQETEYSKISDYQDFLSKQFAALNQQQTKHIPNVALQPTKYLDPAFYRDLFTESGKGKQTLFDYWHDISYGDISLAGTQVYGWYDLPYNTATGEQKDWATLQKDCQSKVNATQKIVGDSTRVIYILNTAKVTGFNCYTDGSGVVTLDSLCWTVTTAAHEMGHGYGLDHSYGVPAFCPTGFTGQYCDPWDIMSANDVYSYTTSDTTCGAHGPAMILPFLQSLGWIPSNNVVSYGTGDLMENGAQTINIMSLNHDPTSVLTPVGIEIYYSTDTGNGKDDHYTVEFREKTGWDQGFPTGVVLVNKVYYVAGQKLPRALLVAALTPDAPIFNDASNNISIKLTDIQPGDQAQINVSSKPIQIPSNPPGKPYPNPPVKKGQCYLDRMPVCQ